MEVVGKMLMPILVDGKVEYEVDSIVGHQISREVH